MIQFNALLKKELREAFRDRRALMVAMLMAIMAPIMIYVISIVVIKETVARPPIYVKLSGESFAPKLIKAFKENNILFSFSVPVYDKINEIEFQYQLVGIYDDWSSWMTESFVEFKNLPPGEYVFNVKARIGNSETVSW